MTAPVPPAPTILILDDAVDSLCLVETFLRRQGFRVLTAGDGRMGLELAAANRPDLVVTDLLMPGMSGFRVVDRLKHDPNYQPRVVMMSAMDAPLHRAYATALGVDDFLSKPFPLRELLESIRRLCPPAADEPADTHDDMDENTLVRK